MSEQVVGRIFYESAPVEDAIRSFKVLPNGVVKMEAILQDADAENRNKRVYPKSVINNSLRHPFVQEKLATNSLFGEMNHPDAKLGLERQLKIDMHNVCHLIKNPRWDDRNPNLLIGDVETTGNAVGKDLAGLIVCNNMLPSFSMRGAGDVVNKRGVAYVKDPMRLITWDNVHYPSHKVAYARAMNEDVNEVPITAKMLAEYVASNSKNTQMILEDVMQLSGGTMSFSVDKGKVLITEKKSGKLAGFALVEANLQAEYQDAILSIMR